MPSVKKSIRVSGRGSFMGGDFENNDVFRLNLVGDYTHEIIEELPDQYVLKLKGRDLSLAYAQIKLWVRKNDLQPLKQEYYTISGELIKTTLYQDIKDYNGLKRPSKLVMQSALDVKQKTILEMVTFEWDVEKSTTRFQKSNLREVVPNMPGVKGAHPHVSRQLLNTTQRGKKMSTKQFVIGILLLFACSDSFAMDKDIPAGGKNALEILGKVSKILSLENIRSEQVMTVARKMQPSGNTG